MYTVTSQNDACVRSIIRKMVTYQCLVGGGRGVMCPASALYARRPQSVTSQINSYTSRHSKHIMTVSQTHELISDNLFSYD